MVVESQNAWVPFNTQKVKHPPCAAFEVPDRPLDALAADQVGNALLAIAREPAHAARGAIDALSAPSRTALIRVYFRLLERAAEDRRLSH